MLPRYLERVLTHNQGKVFRPEELARAVTRAIRRDTGTDAAVGSRSVGAFLQHHGDELGFVTKIPDPAAGDRYLYSYAGDDGNEEF